ncbi:hypothetical protein TTHERM_00089180 (macronuclear) [Tetrahymena thermophila SB210]|uniref:Uncharacterized protein n=1 Tax=Tetrahymena thermophila (strain SB210) TaxID=312017 RepID=Q236H7_TETTS|nr:hypothetical protein TTHERM_00089180 [Tetrahymena thermophila SB210]EAR92523.2 hypothetical protein TTHERM_00089180 [Tetrahymena thermophila SB210]|eukprot:XP_001012768.2 hypothetical protein TTHERM_00089180 [Tetrahymena thermophila SB210]
MEIKSIYPNSLIFDDLDNGNFLSESELYKEQSSQHDAQPSQNFDHLEQQISQQNIYQSGDNFSLQDFKKQKKGRTLHLLKNFTEEMKLRWNMDQVEIRIHNYLDENQVYITDPMQKQMDYYQRIKSQVISSVILSNQQCSSDEEGSRSQKKEFEDEIQVIQKTDCDKQNNNEEQDEDDNDSNISSFDENELQRENPQNIVDYKVKQQGTMSYLDSISTTNSLNSQLSLQRSSILLKRRQHPCKTIDVCQQAPHSLSQIDDEY